ncbi:MAG: hypothetical protein K2J90_04120 [Lachnospiraceae bacterium]|nr:hypothetical protein [Lachnospiraceae bacterium]
MSEKTGRVHWNGWQECVKKICSIRFAGAVVLMTALVCAIASGIDRVMIDQQEWITPWMAPHFFDNKYFATFYGFIVCYMFSDVPFMNRSELCFALRKGRGIWCMEKIFAVIMQAFSLTVLTFAATVLVFVPRLHFELDWGSIIDTMAYSENIWEYNLISNPSSVIMEKYTPLLAMLLCFLLVWIISSVIGLLMFVLSLYTSRMAAVSVAAILTGMNLSEAKFITSSWLPYVTPFNWCRLGLHNEPVFLDTHYYPSLWFCLGLCGIMIIFTALGIMLRSRHMEFVWNKEE